MMAFSKAYMWILLMLIMISVNNVLSRTCVCAEFNAISCDSIMNCKWNLNTPKDGNFGVCRSLKWYTCRLDPSCKIKSDLEQQDENMEFDDVDWPWDCKTYEYLPKHINVNPYQFDAHQNALKQSFIAESIPNVESASSVVLLIVLVSLAMICIAIYYGFMKYKNKDANNDHTEKDVVKYKTVEYYQRV